MAKILVAKNLTCWQNDKNQNEISVIDSLTYEEIPGEVIKIEFSKREKMNSKNIILSMAVCENERSLAIIYGEK